jgi:hypothetical protein
MKKNGEILRGYQFDKQIDTPSVFLKKGSQIL